MKTITRWIFIETGEDGHEYTGGLSKTRKESVEYYKRLCVDGTAFGKPGETVEYVKLTGTRK